MLEAISQRTLEQAHQTIIKLAQGNALLQMESNQTGLPATTSLPRVLIRLPICCRADPDATIWLNVSPNEVLTRLQSIDGFVLSKST